MISRELVGVLARIPLLAVAIGICFATLTRAQLLGDTGREKVVGRSVGNTPTRPVARPVGRTVTVERKVYLTPTTGSLSVATAPNAVIELDRVGDARDPINLSMPTDGSQAIFNKLVPGDYRVSAELDGYTTAERTVHISRNEQEGILLDIRPVTYTVTVTTNVAGGEIRYGRVRKRYDPVTNSEKYDAVGSTCMIPIQNGQAVLTNLQAGDYGIDVRPADVGYAIKPLSYNPAENGGVSQAFEARVERVLSDRTFSAAWTGGEWDLPAGWRLGPPMQTGSGGVALPHEETVRHYRNFKLVTDVRLSNGVGVSLALRAADTQNYYLVRVTGPSAPEPLKLLGYVVKNGVRQPPFTVINLSHLRDVIAPGKYFNLELNVAGNQISVVLNDSTLGGQYPLGALVDSFGTYPIGAVGLAASDNERTEIGGFTITPNLR